MGGYGEHATQQPREISRGGGGAGGAGGAHLTRFHLLTPRTQPSLQDEKTGVAQDTAGASRFFPFLACRQTKTHC